MFQACLQYYWQVNVDGGLKIIFHKPFSFCRPASSAWRRPVTQSEIKKLQNFTLKLYTTIFQNKTTQILLFIQFLYL